MSRQVEEVGNSQQQDAFEKPRDSSGLFGYGRAQMGPGARTIFVSNDHARPSEQVTPRSNPRHPR
jgi:hypothetical protein